MRAIDDEHSDDPGFAESEVSLHLAVEAAPIAIVLMELDGYFSRANPAACEMLERTPEEMRRLTFRDVLHADDRDEGKTAFAKLAGGELDHYRGERRFVRKSGEILWGALTVTAIPDESGKIRGAFAMVEDVTEQRLAEEHIKELNEELEERVEQRTARLTAVNQELEAFCYSVSHDLRAPLRAMEGFAEILLEGYRTKLDGEGTDYLRRIGAASRRLGRLIDELLKLSRLTREDLRPVRILLSEAAERVADEFRTSDPRRNVEFEIEKDMVARADAALINDVLHNLIGNSWKFTASRDPAIIEFGTTETEHGKAMFVRDNGVGFDMAHADKIFSPFERIHPVEEFEGDGVGLATVHRIITRHGGTIWAKAEPGAGATFYFTL